MRELQERPWRDLARSRVCSRLGPRNADGEVAEHSWRCPLVRPLHLKVPAMSMLPLAHALVGLLRRDGVEPLPPVRYRFESLDGVRIAWKVGELRLEERLGSTYACTLEIVNNAHFTHVDYLVGHRVHVEIEREHECRNLYGVIESALLVAVSPHEVVVQVRVVPAFFVLGLNSQSRVWQDMSVQDVIDQILTEQISPLGCKWQWNLAKEPPICPCITQYQESDRALIERLLAQSGISYYFEQDSKTQREVLVFVGTPQALPKYRGPDKTRSALTVLQRQEDLDYHLGVQNFRKSQMPTAASLRVETHDWTAPECPVVGEAGNRALPLGAKHLQLHDLGLSDRSAIETQAKLLLARSQRDDTTASATTNLILLEAGQVLTFEQSVGLGLAKSDKPAENYSVRTVSHHGKDPDVYFRSGDERPEKGFFRNQIVCVPADERALSLPYRKPTAAGPLTGVVVDESGNHEVAPDGSPIFCDQWGRVRVRLHFMMHAPEAPQYFPWLRVMQTMAWQGSGTQFIPRIGTPVIVGFLNGDVDQPFIQGCLYDANSPPPFATPDFETISGIKTNNTKGEPAHELSFEDAADAEHLHIWAKKDFSTECGDRFTEQVGGNRDAVIKGSSSTSVSGGQSLSVGGKQSASIGGGNEVSVTGLDKLGVQGDRVVEISGDLQTTVSEGITQRAKRVQSEVEESLTIACEEATIQASKTITLDCGDARSTHVVSCDCVTTHAPAVELAATPGPNASPISMIRLDGDTIEIHAQNLRIVVGDKFSVEADTIELKATKECSIDGGAKLKSTADAIELN